MDQTSTTHRAPHTRHCAPRATRRTPAQELPEPQRDHQILPNNVARNSPRSFFDYASKRCNSNATNSKFEISARELRATFMEGPAASRPGGTPRRPAAPGGKQALRHQDRVTRVGRHRDRRLVTTVNAATASSIEESGPALHRVPGPSAQRQSSEMGVTP